MAKNEVPTVKLRRTSAGNLRNFFFIFTVIGVASIVIVRGLQDSLLLQMALPGLVVLFYAIFIFNKGRNVLNLDQLGDSVYYLGFILTLAALILALYDLSDDPTAEDIIPKFAIALTTTVVGIFVRVFMSQFAASQEDINEMSERMLSDTALSLKTQLDMSTSTFKNLIDEMSRKTSESLEKNSIETIIDDTDENFSSKIKKMNLIGAPFQIIIGKQVDGELLEFKETGKETQKLGLGEIIKIIKEQKAKIWSPH